MAAVPSGISLTPLRIIIKKQYLCGHETEHTFQLAGTLKQSCLCGHETEHTFLYTQYSVTGLHETINLFHCGPMLPKCRTVRFALKLKFWSVEPALHNIISGKLSYLIKLLLLLLLLLG
jgi:hypothetical protein